MIAARGILLGVGACLLVASSVVALVDGAPVADAIDCTKKRNRKRPACQATATPAPRPTATPAPSGDLPGWELVFEDTFSRDVPLGAFSGCDGNGCDGLAPYPHTAARWGAYTDGWPDTFGQGTYSPSRVLSIRDGVLRYDLHTSADGIHRVAAVLPLIPRGQTYGRFALRVRADSMPCYRFNSLLWPDSGAFPGEGEIDFPESWLDSTLRGFLHHRGATLPNDQTQLSAGGARWSSWHTTVVEWRPNDARFYVDGQMTARVTSRVPNTPMHSVMQTEVGKSCAVDDVDRGAVLIDWVRAWRAA